MQGASGELVRRGCDFKGGEESEKSLQSSWCLTQDLKGVWEDGQCCAHLGKECSRSRRISA